MKQEEIGPMKLSEYILNCAIRGACCCRKCIDASKNPEKHQPGGHTVDVIFFKVSNIRGEKEKFKSLIKNIKEGQMLSKNF